MKTETILGIGALIVLVAFIVFAFRQGMNVKPSGDAGGGDTNVFPPSDSSG
jgi:hypothetical protein